MGPLTESCGPESWRLTINVCDRAHRGPVCSFLMFWLQIAIQPFALFHHSVCDYVCFNVMFHCCDRGLL